MGKAKKNKYYKLESEWKDINGKTLKEGDIYICHSDKTRRYLVQFKYGSFVGGSKDDYEPLGWKAGWAGDIFKEDNILDDTLEIIGNIHDNPELWSDR